MVTQHFPPFPSNAFLSEPRLSASISPPPLPSIPQTQPVFFGNREGTLFNETMWPRPSVYFQGAAYGFNRAGLVAALPFVDLPALRQTDAWAGSEDAFAGDLAASARCSLVHCGSFVWLGKLYTGGWEAGVYPLPAAPITVHKLGQLGPLLRHAPDGLCDAWPGDEVPWRCEGARANPEAASPPPANDTAPPPPAVDKRALAARRRLRDRMSAGRLVVA